MLTDTVLGRNHQLRNHTTANTPRRLNNQALVNLDGLG
jgi:hypothetical protein